MTATPRITIRCDELDTLASVLAWAGDMLEGNANDMPDGPEQDATRRASAIAHRYGARLIERGAHIHIV